ncbi:hypothetical protein [Tenuibacillus multivorans]|uniref:Uncharacterized protein n=1 Tax=Tenuibacillus multivorans TaxID=237069 RepID=A0A1H0F9M6_9BACI|nr:hypothetical protein [Tenuibacillus multivorans]GEL78853.1 hypothetical protein TMU01_30880 [Tenuibacillus multivorans]SDN91300.1 hypothetical protein SAMN05216498_0196 [Tenuibacillus multivorans]
MKPTVSEQDIYIINEQETEINKEGANTAGHSEVSNWDFKKAQFETSRNPKKGSQEILNRDTSNTYINNTEDEEEINNNTREKKQFSFTKTDQQVLEILEQKPIYEKAGEFLYSQIVPRADIQGTILELEKHNVEFFKWEHLKESSI